MIDEDRSTWTLGQLADEAIEACELPTGCRGTIIAALGDAKDQGAAELRAYAELATEALTELLRQVEAFVAENGEADFYTGQAKEVLAKNPFDPLRHETGKIDPADIGPLTVAAAVSRELQDECHQSCTKPWDAFRWTGDLDAFEKWYGSRLAVDFGGQISVPEGEPGRYLRVWCGSWVVRSGKKCWTLADDLFHYMLDEYYPGDYERMTDQRPESGTQVPEGWKLVPLEPTEAQLKAIDGYIGHWTGNFSHDREGNALAYKAMLEAAPSKEPPMLPTRESERAKVVAQVGECCRGADPACTGGCLVERALRPQKGPPPGPPDPPKPPWHDPKG